MLLVLGAAAGAAAGLVGQQVLPRCCWWPGVTTCASGCCAQLAPGQRPPRCCDLAAGTWSAPQPAAPAGERRADIGNTVMNIAVVCLAGLAGRWLDWQSTADCRWARSTYQFLIATIIDAICTSSSCHRSRVELQLCDDCRGEPDSREAVGVLWILLPAHPPVVLSQELVLWYVGHIESRQGCQGTDVCCCLGVGRVLAGLCCYFVSGSCFPSESSDEVD